MKIIFLLKKLFKKINKKEQKKYIISEGYQPKVELPKDYKLPEALRKAFFLKKINKRVNLNKE